MRGAPFPTGGSPCLRTVTVKGGVGVTENKPVAF